MDQLQQFLKQHKLLGKLNTSFLDKIEKTSKLYSIEQGQGLCRQNIIEEHTFLVLSGSFRLLAINSLTKDLYTVGNAIEADIIGLVDLLRQSSCEIAIARQNSKVLAIENKLIIDILKEDKNLEILSEVQSPCESAKLLEIFADKLNPPPLDLEHWIRNRVIKGKGGLFWEDKISANIYLSTATAGSKPYFGKTLTKSQYDELKEIHPVLPMRFWRYTGKLEEVSSNKIDINEAVEVTSKQDNPLGVDNSHSYKEFDISHLGIAEAKSDFDLEGIKLIRGKGVIQANLAILKMISNTFNTPIPIDLIEKSLETIESKNIMLPIQTLGQLVETMGFQTQVGSVKLLNLRKIDFPAIIKLDNKFVLLTNASKTEITFADPEKGWVKKDINELVDSNADEIDICLIKLLQDAAQKQFGWNWFSPAIKKYKWSLTQVLLASLFIQLFQLANPLLLQQIIDKVISQSNLSALQVLGGALVLAAILQGLLTAVRTWLLIDTTDRMDLMLGTQVIDKLLRLPLRFFEKRPVGELSQRLGELSNLRSFLTGTAITSALDLLFAFIYIFIMFNYSPLLTIVALSTIPLYVGMILFIAPIYRRLIRKQAQYNAKTQSHLIETLSGIQTVKAQHVELGSRWKWQERYSNQIAEGFKSVVLGSSVGEIGNFLNQVSSLFVLWVGVYQVVNGDLSLGQLIAFRIIAGYVTGPILRLSSLWQGFQQVGISMERLSDIVDQKSENDATDSSKIGLPPIKGQIEFENIKFKFGEGKVYQVNGVNLSIPSNSFVGIVGQSGSGKSTLMKLLPRLYSPESGRILIDGYDIAKVNLNSVREQVGIVPQDCLLFEGTIRDNICMNAPDSKNEEVINAAKSACAHEFIMELPEGYATRIGERGAGLSGGQKQRIAIARTLLQDPNLLILDEATSALDYDTESNVCRNLQAELDGKTVFFITHRLSTVKNADIIVLMHQGKVEEIGNHNQLLQLNGRYAALYAHQGDE